MSLFRLSEWFSTDIPHSSCIAVGNLIQDRDQLIVGGSDGLISVLDPGRSGREEDSTVLQKHTGRPVVQMDTGQFLPMPGKTLAVLSTNTLTFYVLVYDEADLSKSALQEISVHQMEEAAWNMCSIPGTPSTQLLVQSIGCGLTLFQGDQCQFSRTPLPSLLPGALSYHPSSSSLVIASGGRLHSVKFSLLSALSSTGKKVTFDWVLSLGDHAIDMAVEEGPPTQPCIVVLCRRNVFCVSTGGVIRWQIRLECVATKMMVYKTGAEIAQTRLCIATNTNTLLVYRDNRLVWNCQTDFLPIDLKISSYTSTYQHVISMLSVDGRIVIGFLGTEPNLYKVATDSRFVDYKARIEEMRSLESSIKDGGGISESKTAFAMKCHVMDIEKAQGSSRSDVPSCPVRITYEGVEPGEKVHLNIHSALQFEMQERSSDGDVIVFSVGSTLPINTKATIVAHCTGSQATCVETIVLPLAICLVETSPERNAKHKIVLDSDRNIIPLNELFPDYQTENPATFALQVYNQDATVSIFTATKSNRYRIQSDQPGLLYIAVFELVRRIREKQVGTMLNANLPIETVVPMLETHMDQESKASSAREVISQRAREVRSVQALLLSKSKNTKPEPLEHIDFLYDVAHSELLESIDRLSSCERQLAESSLALSALFDLVALVMGLNKTEATIDGHFYANTQQSLGDRLAWAAGISAEPSRMLAVLCRHTSKGLANISEEAEEEDDFRAPDEMKI